jgi:dUTP pyrophosphatase
MPDEVRVSGSGTLPRYATPGSAGADLCASEDVTIAPGARLAVPTGIHVAIPEGHVGLIWPRSGLAVRNGIDTLAGVIDCDYRGEVRVVLVNHGSEPVALGAGDRIAQLLVQRVERVAFCSVGSLEDTQRGTGGFGSTGA